MLQIEIRIPAAGGILPMALTYYIRLKVCWGSFEQVKGYVSNNREVLWRDGGENYSVLVCK